MIRKFFILFFLFLSCNAFGEPKYCKLSDKILFSYNKELRKKYRLSLAGHGGAMMNGIQKVNIHYVSLASLGVEEARRLYVGIIEGLLCRYNQNEEIRPFLKDYPLTIANLKVMIGFQNVQHNRVNQEFVALIFNSSKNWIIYSAYDHEKKKFIDLHEEPYETARDIVMKE